MPPMLAIDRELGRAELTREKLFHLLSIPLFAVEDDRARFYMAGVLLKTGDDKLVGVGTDGRRLVHVSTAFAAGTLSEDHTLIIPLTSARATVKLLTRIKVETVTVRRSKALIEITTPDFTLVSKLIDAQFPQYERLLPKQPSTDFAIVDRRKLARALARLTAVVDGEISAPPIIGLEWYGQDQGADRDRGVDRGDGGALRLNLLRQPDAADDSLDADTGGAGQTALALDQLVELVDGLQGERLRLDFNGTGAPMVVMNNQADDGILVLQMPIFWNFGTAAAA
jgi:DNA polymerase III subunit beta